MNAKSRYRLQLKLQAALARVVEVLDDFRRHDLAPNTKNLFMAAGVSDLLIGLVADIGRAPAEKDFDPGAVTQAASAILRRRKETKARGLRMELDRLRRNGHPI